MPNPGPKSGPFLVVMLAWLVLACAAGVSGRVAALVPPQPQIVVAVLSVLLFLSGLILPGLRAWLAEVNLRGFVAFHVTRFVGILFLVLSARGELSPEWAVPAGWGDIAVALGALLIAAFMRRPETRPDLVRLWNLIGLRVCAWSAGRQLTLRPSTVRSRQMWTTCAGASWRGRHRP